jgi:16S rRNA (cytosine967-C5)-methyltransferase
MQAFKEGRFAVQDGAAQLVSLLLNPRPGETVLDACAGLGGKTTHLAQIMENRGRIVALDHIAAKLERLEKEARRLGVEIIETRRLDLNRRPDPESLPVFDRILLDAPCSGLGVLRRNPDAKWSAHKRDIAGFARRQQRFLDHLAPLVKPGGVLVFAVCSMEPEENEQVIADFLKKHPDFDIKTPGSIQREILHPFVDADGFLRTTPQLHNMDGFFAARLTRRG